MVKKSPKIATRFEAVYKSPKKLITAILIGNNIANVAASATATALLLKILEQAGINNLAVSMSIITAIITVILLIFGEITPKTIALKQPEKLALFLSKPILYFVFVMSPIIYIFNLFSQLISSTFSLSSPESQHFLSIEEMKTMLDVGREEGVLEKEKNEMLLNVFDFSETVVREIMTPRTDTICININDSIQEAIHLIIEKGHSRIPIYEDKIDNIIGIIYAKDLLSISKEDSQESVRKFMRNPIFIPESKNIEDLLQQMKLSKFHLAIVVDEYGGMAGIVTLEDIVEEIIGEIQDEYDQEDHSITKKIHSGHYVVDASLNMKDLGEELDHEFPEHEDYDTVGGLILNELGKFPQKGETIFFEGFSFKVQEVKKRRIIKVVIEKHTSNPT